MCRDGGIGIRARLKIVYRKVCEFKSHSRHIVKKKDKLLIIVGPTASGKTSLSIELAKKFNGEIISADSRQIYRGLDIGTGKVTADEMEGIPHHLLDVADPNDTYTVADFVRDGRSATHDIVSRGKLPIVVGGTFFYVDALLGRFIAPSVLPDPELRAKLERLDNETLFSMLKEKDPRRADDIDRHNPQRLVRALEIVAARGAVPSHAHEELYDALTIGIDITKEQLLKNIHARLVTRIDAGMIDEVERLHANGLSYERLEGLGIEYRYIGRMLQGMIDHATMLREIETKSWQYAKRQMTWLKRDQGIVWVDKNKIEMIAERIERFLKD